MSQSYYLENEAIKVEISTDGAQIYSFIFKEDGSERMWNGDKAYWGQRSPILFPQVGNTHDKKQVFKGKECHLGNHGFARYSRSTLVEKTEDSLTMEIVDDETTYKDYPYHFSLRARYTILGAKLEIAYSIENRDEETMPFGFGLHPAFRCPIYEGEKFSDYCLNFSSLEGDSYPAVAMIDGHDLHLDYSIFEKKPTLFYHDLVSNTITLTSGSHGMRVSGAGYPFWGIWTPMAPFICIEPWFSHSNFEENDLPFEEREGIINLEKGRIFYCAYSIEAF